MHQTLRTIILQQVRSPSGGSSYWALNENGVILDGLGTDELLWAVSSVLHANPLLCGPYRGGKTVEEHRTAAFREGALAGLRRDTRFIATRGQAALDLSDPNNPHFDRTDMVHIPED